MVTRSKNIVLNRITLTSSKISVASAHPHTPETPHRIQLSADGFVYLISLRRQMKGMGGGCLITAAAGDDTQFLSKFLNDDHYDRYNNKWENVANSIKPNGSAPVLSQDSRESRWPLSPSAL
ncbi:hypothetical protein Ddc_09555 [Ditylenchus destructor]|nr:hypothetical protein Ddc_09555 [Ditylenchus destructor]